jgi:Tol biopolymer transport system component
MTRLSMCVSLGMLGMLVLMAAGPPAAQAAYPGQDGRIAFVRAGGIYSAKPDGSGVVRLTATSGDSQPVWSPDGRRIAFVRNNQIWTMNANGTAQTRVTVAGGEHPTWSPDGKWLAFDRGTFAGQIYKLRSTAPYGTAIALTSQGSAECPTNYAASWSSTGRIAYVHDQENCDPNLTSPRIYTMNADGTGKTFLTGPCGCLTSYSDWGPQNQLDWGPQGKAVLFDQFSEDPNGPGPGYSNGSHIYVHLANGTTTDLSSGLAAYYFDLNPAYSPAGTRIVFDRRFDNTDVGDTAKALGIWVMNADGTHRHRILTYGTDPNWGSNHG